jgi:hypothetical protein
MAPSSEAEAEKAEIAKLQERRRTLEVEVVERLRDMTRNAELLAEVLRDVPEPVLERAFVLAGHEIVDLDDEGASDARPTA